ncbi:hypothetical protein FRC04_003548 [Tulasnella sp. 424]|nr:hypothetical protein FRC04_003548 [Tulasnella sp. 424]KAG8974962.1 hypothetical protein FRC05_006639 [Tulasnella sp. 425]
MISTTGKLVFALALAISAAAAPFPTDGSSPVGFDGQASRNFPRTHQIKRLVVFGDSFSDDGHGAWVVSNHTWPADPAYYQHSFSNGPVWPVVLSGALGISNRLEDRAIGGATSNNTAVQGYTGADSTIPVPSMLDQIAKYIAKTPASHGHSDSLYALVAGANDIFFYPSASSASNFIVISYPDLALLPFAKDTPPTYRTLLSAYSKDFANSLSSLARNPPKGTRIAYVDLYTLFGQILAHPERYGFSPRVVGQNCIRGAYPTEGVRRSVCSDPDKRAFSDIYHPSAKTHKIIAAEAILALAKVL